MKSELEMTENPHLLQNTLTPLPKRKHKICEHGSYKQQCRQCKGGSICEHNKRRTICVDCGGGSICEHKKERVRCRECKGASYCHHNKLRSYCIDCGGGSMCEHGKYRSLCLQCGGKSLCEHGIRKQICKHCEGASMCEHRRQRRQCKECNGNDICHHGKRTSYCKYCGGSALCKSEWCHTIVKSKQKYNGYCLSCCINLCPDTPVYRNYKTKEKDVVDRITSYFPNFTWIADKRVQDGCSKRRPDLLLDMGSHIVIIEIDENKHTDYDCSCENKRLMELSQDLQHRPVIFIRFNPDDYINQDGVLVKSCWKLNKLGIMQIMKTKIQEWNQRMETLIQQIQYWVNNPTDKTVEIVELFY